MFGGENIITIFDPSYSEKRIEDILFRFPYLIDPDLEGCHLIRQYCIKRGGAKLFVDLLYMDNERCTVIEIKKVRLGPVDLSQLSLYVDYFTNEIGIKNVKGILIGPDMKDELKNIVKRYKHYKIFLFGREIPKKVRMCRRCRKVFDINLSFCPYCIDR